MSTDLTDLLHDVTVLHRFVDFIDDYCKGQERSQTYADASGLFFSYVKDLSAGIREELPRQIQLANKFPSRLPALRSRMLTLKRYLRMLHALVKPAADAHTLTIPAPLIDLASDQLLSVEGMRKSKIVVLLASELMYFQWPHTGIKIQARYVQEIIPHAIFPPKLGFIELPYSQGPSFFTNLAIYHEIGHFVYEELSTSVPPNPGFSQLRSSIARSLKQALPTHTKDPQALTVALRIIENWTQEIFCDLFAIKLVGPAFSLSFIEMLGMLGFLSRSSSIRFNPTHPAPAFRLAEHVQMLRDDSWWDAIADINSNQKRTLEQLTALPSSSYRFYIDEKKQGPQSLVTIFLDIVTPEIRRLVQSVTKNAACSAARFTRDRETIEKCLLAGIVPHKPNSVPLNPVSIINASFFFYLTSIPQLITKFENGGAPPTVEVFSKWTKRVEMWTMKAIDDSRLYERLGKVKVAPHGPQTR
jgi:hypothetical protein